MTKTRFNLYEYASKYGLEKLIKIHAFKNRKKIELTDEQVAELNTYYKVIKVNIKKGFDQYDKKTFRKTLRRILKCRWFDSLKFDLKDNA